MKVKQFIESYQKAFDAFDAEAIADLYHYPSLIASMDQSQAMVSRDDAVKYFARVCDSHRRMGYHRALLLNSERSTLTENLAMVTVRWRFETSTAQVIVEFDCTYTLCDLGQGVKAFSAVVHG
ncbi:MAG: hypothetical protein AB8B96_04445 [Lysobacterales bacterium]